MRVISTFVLLALASTAAAQEWPEPTEEGKKALDDLIRRCVAARVLTAGRGQSGSEPVQLTIADAVKLEAELRASRPALTPALCDALVAQWAKTGADQRAAIETLLRAVGEVADDRRTLAFADFCQAKREEMREPARSIRLYIEANERFVDKGELAWQAACHNNIGLIYYRQGEHAQSLERFQRALDIRLAIYGERHPDVAQSYNNVASVYDDQEEYARALECYEKALDIYRAIYGERHPKIAFTHNHIGLEYDHQDESAKALGHFQKALEIRQAIYGEQHPDTAISHSNVGLTHGDLGEHAKALEHLQQALAIRRALHGEQHPDVAECLNNIGSIYYELDRFAEALECHQKALEIRLKVLEERDPDIAISHWKIGRVLMRQQEFARALDSFQKALKIERLVYGEQHPDVATTLKDIGELYWREGDAGSSYRYIEKSLKIRRAILGERHPEVAECLNFLGLVFYDQGEYAKALGYLEQALDIEQETLGRQHPEVAFTLNHMGNIYSSQGDNTRALQHHQRALEIRRKVFGEDITTAYSLGNIGSIFEDLGRYTEALDHYRQALSIRRRIHGERHPDVASSLYDLGEVYHELGDDGESLKFLDLAIDSLSTSPDPTLPPLVLRTADQLRALPLTEDVLEYRGWIMERKLGNTPTIVGLRECLRTYELAADVVDRVREHVIETEQSKLSLGERSSDLVPSLIGVAARLADQDRTLDGQPTAFIAAERGAARVFLEGLGRARAKVVGRVGGDLLAEEADILQRLRELDGRIDHEQANPSKTRDRALVERLFLDRQRVEDQLQRLIARMERAYPQYAALKYPRPCSIEQARVCLTDDEVALLDVPGIRASYLIVLPKQSGSESSGISIHRLAPADELAELVSALTQPAVLEDASGARELGARAYRMLLAPAAEAIRGKGLVLVPGGALGLLPFELLVEPAEGAKDAAAGDGRFLVEGHRLRYAPSLTALHLVRQWEQSRPRPERPLWAVGDPVYEATDSRLTSPTTLAQETRYEAVKYRGGVRGEAFPRLPATGAEVEQLRQFLGADPDEMLVGREATEAAVKATSESGRMATYRYVHFATHGILGLADGTPPSLVLSLIGDQRGEDGFLTLGEVTGLRLNADLVVLSACQTGQGRLYNAEGVSGLARAFLSAGSRAVLCSLWRVADQATAELMTAVYAGLKEKKPAADALRDAQLKMIADGQPPLYWAPFILIGE